MDASDFFRKAVVYKLKEKKQTQVWLAKKLKIAPPDLNSFLKGGRNFSENRKEKLAQILGTTYIDMLILGRDLVDAERSPPGQPIELFQRQIINRFRDKDTALRLNQKLITIEAADPERYRQVVDYIDLVHEHIKKKKEERGKKNSKTAGK